MARDLIRIHGLTLECIVGLRPHEREREQPVNIDLELGLDLSRAARSGRIADTCDYDLVAEEVRALLQFRRYRLIEMAVQELAAMLLGVHTPVDTVRLRLEKPRALEGRARGAAVEVTRSRRDLEARTETTKFGEVEILTENREAGLYLLHVDAHKAIPPHRHEVMRELEWLVDGELERDGVAMTSPQPVVWPLGRVHGYRNVSDRRATIFCCDAPAFIPEDEIEVAP